MPSMLAEACAAHDRTHIGAAARTILRSASTERAACADDPESKHATILALGLD